MVQWRMVNTRSITGPTSSSILFVVFCEISPGFYIGQKSLANCDAHLSITSPTWKSQC